MGNPENTTKVNILNDGCWIFIEELSIVDTELTLREPFKMAGFSIDEEALQYAIKASAGYPFLIQLIWYQIWWSLASRSTKAHIGVVREAIGHIMVAFNDSVIEGSLVGLNRESLNLLAVIAMFDGPVYFSTVNKEPGCLGHQLPSNCIELARRKLLHFGEAKDAVFGIPHLREYLRPSTFLKPLG